ncbi:MAG: phage integrase N-terminal SAM-like domain-containing protein [Deltaproteobacteria bacterium]|nr:phage integrase N-terminal SAM-like domain-containing protein [Deltaproteobacteria bacterium]
MLVLIGELKHYSIRTEKTYVSWIKRFILFHHKKRSNEMGCAGVRSKKGYLLMRASFLVMLSLIQWLSHHSMGLTKTPLTITLK